MIRDTLPARNFPLLHAALSALHAGLAARSDPAGDSPGRGDIRRRFPIGKLAAPLFIAVLSAAGTIAPVTGANAQSGASPDRPAQSTDIPFSDEQPPDSGDLAGRGLPDRQGLQGEPGISDEDDTPPPPASYLADTAEGVYAVAGLEVSASAADGEQARRAAQASGRAQAMDILLRRLTAEEDWVYLPKLSLGQQADAARAPEITGGADITAPELTDNPADDPLREGRDQGPPIPGFDFSGKEAVILESADLPALEEGFAVFDEKSSPTTYQARITYRFKEDDVRRILISAGLPFSDSQSRMALILPILQTDTGLYLWEHNNPWARAWLARPLINELTPLRLPAGDVTDTQIITADEAKSFSQDALSLLARRYDAAQVIIAQGDLTRKDGRFRLRVRLHDAFLEGRVDPQITVSAATSATLYDENPDDIFTNLPLFDAWFNGDTGDFPALARRAVETTIARYASGWKKQTIVDHTVKTQLILRAYFSDIREWNLIRDTLTQSPLIARFSTGLLATSGTTIDIELLGSISQLVLAMQQRGLIVWSSDDQTWNIATGNTARAVRAREDPVLRIPGSGELDPDARGGRPGSPNGPVGPAGPDTGPARAGQPRIPAPPPGSWRQRAIGRQEERDRYRATGAPDPLLSGETGSLESGEGRVVPQSILPDFAPINGPAGGQGPAEQGPAAIGGAADPAGDAALQVQSDDRP